MKMTSTEYWYTENGEDVSNKILTVEVYTTQDDEHIATIDLKYKYDENSDEWQLDDAQWHTDLQIKEIDSAVEQLCEYAANGGFHDFAYHCYEYDPKSDEDWWCV